MKMVSFGNGEWYDATLAADGTGTYDVTAATRVTSVALLPGGPEGFIYVPFGSHWYEYSLRRLQENPSVAGYIASDTFGR